MENRRSIPVTSALPVRDRIVIWGALAAITLLSWVYLVRMPMTAHDFAAIAARALSAMPAGWANLWLTFLMWAVMMVAMMLPSATPMITTYARMARGRGRSRFSHVWLFALGYIFVWTAFSAAAALAQAAMESAAIISGALSATPVVGGIILIAAGIYQLTPLKEACLGHCRSPIGFFMTEWRGGGSGALAMGLKHGALCVGCCWMLMLILFATGVMNLAWVAAISILVLLEKVTPYGGAIARVAGVSLAAAGFITLLFH